MKTLTKTIGIAGLSVAMALNVNADSTRLKSIYDFNSGDFSYFAGISSQSDDELYNRRFSEFARINFDGKGNLIANVRLPEFSLGNSDNKVEVKVVRDNEKLGFGVDTIHNLQDLTLKLNADYRTDKTRVGGDVEYNFGKFRLGVGYDNISEEEQGFEQILARGVWDVNENNQVGAGYVHRSDDMQSLAGYFLHHGVDEKWGTRTRARYDTLRTGNNLNFEGILVQNPDPVALGIHAGSWIGERDSGDMYDVAVVPNILSKNDFSLSERTRKGFVLGVSGNSGDFGDDLTVETGHVWRTSNGGKLGLSGIYATSDNSSGYGVGIYYGDKNWRILGRIVKEKEDFGGMLQIERGF